ncbi:MAG: ABC transporter ATP-binding protein [Bacilli bacterium]|nr:ABC transporter ATP-binding protein/permease [Bacilli bacterium]
MKTKDIISQALSKKISLIIYFIGTLIISATLLVFCVLIVRTLVDDIFSTPVDEAPKLAFWIGAFAISLTLMIASGIVNKNLALTISSNVTAALSKAAYSTSLRSEINEFEKVDNNEMVSKIINDSSYIGEVYIGKNWYLFLRNIVYLVAFFISMMIINPVLGLITYGSLPLFYMLIRSYDKFYQRIHAKAEGVNLERSRNISEDLEKIRSIKLRNGIEQEEEKLQKLNEKFISSKRTHGMFLDIKENKLFDLLIGLLLTLILGVGGYMSTRGEHIPGTIVAIVIMIPMMYRMFNQLMYNNIYPSFIEVELSSLEEILGIKSELKSEPINSLDEIRSLKFQDVSYTSVDGSIEDVSFELKRGEKLGVLTLDSNNDKIIFELLTKLVRPKEGVISVNNCDFNKINTLYLRSLITAIPDDSELFNDTIANNIIYPLEFDEYKYNDALNKSGLKKLLGNYEDRDQTIINIDNPLSDEMKYRIIFANAFYKDSKIFVLNETDSKLDPRSEEALIEEVFELKNKITIILTDKNYNVVKCDKVLILGNGGVLEYGKVEDLLNDKASTLFSLIKKVKATKSAKIS